MPILGIMASQISGHLGLSVDYLLVAGGGGGASDVNGAGGGDRFLAFSALQASHHLNALRDKRC